MKGLHNRADPEGNATQCFAISAVQLLLAVSRFRFALVRLWKSKEALALCSNVTRTLAKLASALSVGKNQHSAFGEFMNAACYSAATQLSAHLSAGQNDCGEFLMHLLDHLATEPGFDAIIAGNPFDASTRIRLASVFYCGACDHEWEESRAVNDPRYDRCVSVSAAQFRSDSFIEAIDTITGQYEVPDKRCPRVRCQFKGTANTHAKFLLSPDILVLQISRWSKGKKATKPLALPVSTRIEALSSNYALVAAAMHHGTSVRSGHWTAVVSRGSNWFHADDASISRCQLSAELARDKFRRNIVVAVFAKQSAEGAHAQPHSDAEELENDDEFVDY